MLSNHYHPRAASTFDDGYSPQIAERRGQTEVTYSTIDSRSLFEMILPSDGLQIPDSETLWPPTCKQLNRIIYLVFRQ